MANLKQNKQQKKNNTNGKEVINKKKLLEIYNKNYTEEEYFKNNVTFAFSQKQLEEAISKLGAKDKTELATIFGYGDICLKSKVKELYLWVLDKEAQKEKWLKSLSTKEQYIIIEYELYNHECNYTWDIEPVTDLFKNVFDYNDIMRVFHRITKE